MNESQLVMDFIAEHPVAVEAMVERAVKEGVKELLQEEQVDIVKAMKLEVHEAVKNTLLNNRHAIWLKYAETLTGHWKGERRHVETMLKELDNRVLSLEK